MGFDVHCHELSERYTTSIMRIIVICGLVAVVSALVAAGFFLNRDRGHGNRVFIALAVRVALSMMLVAFLVISYWMGWIAPGGLR